MLTEAYYVCSLRRIMYVHWGVLCRCLLKNKVLKFFSCHISGTTQSRNMSRDLPEFKSRVVFFDLVV